VGFLNCQQLVFASALLFGPRGQTSPTEPRFIPARLGFPTRSGAVDRSAGPPPPDALPDPLSADRVVTGGASPSRRVVPRPAASRRLPRQVTRAGFSACAPARRDGCGAGEAAVACRSASSWRDALGELGQVGAPPIGTGRTRCPTQMHAAAGAPKYRPLLQDSDHRPGRRPRRRLAFGAQAIGSRVRARDPNCGPGDTGRSTSASPRLTARRLTRPLFASPEPGRHTRSPSSRLQAGIGPIGGEKIAEGAITPPPSGPGPEERGHGCQPDAITLEPSSAAVVPTSGRGFPAWRATAARGSRPGSS
jgi:hypothetical protein